MAVRLSDDDWPSNGSEAPLCLLPLRLADVERGLGLAAGDPCPPATATYRVLSVQGHVLRLQVQPASGSVQVWVRGDVQTPGRCLSLLCAALGLREEQLPWVAEELGPKPWLLARLDDNGNRVPMWYFSTRDLAEKVARDYAARGHRQSYEVEQVA